MAMARNELESTKQDFENKYCRCVHVVLAATVNVDVVLVVLVLPCRVHVVRLTIGLLRLCLC